MRRTRQLLTLVLLTTSLVQFSFQLSWLPGSVAHTVTPVTLAASRGPVRAPHGMVASTSNIASQVGVDILKAGGNAVDAAIAVAFAEAVTHPAAGNIGGGGFMMIRLSNGTATAIDYREMGPAAATRNVYLDKDGNL